MFSRNRWPQESLADVRWSLFPAIPFTLFGVICAQIGWLAMCLFLYRARNGLAFDYVSIWFIGALAMNYIQARCRRKPARLGVFTVEPDYPFQARLFYDALLLFGLLVATASLAAGPNIVRSFYRALLASAG